MAIDPGGGRRVYRPSGRVSWPRFWWCAAAVMAAALGVAFVLDRLPAPVREHFWTVGVAMLLLAFAGRAAIGGSHCRNQWVAILLLEAAGVVVVAGCHGLAWVHPQWGKADAESLKLLDLYFIVYSFVAVVASLRARRAYCEACGRWMERQRVIAPAGIASSLAAAIKGGTLRSFAPVSSVGMTRRDEHAVVGVEYCPASMDKAVPCPAYLTLEEKSPQAKRGAEDEAGELAVRSMLHANPEERELRYDPMSGGKLILRQAELSPDEVLLLAEKIPALILAASAFAGPPECDSSEAPPGSLPTGMSVTTLPPGQAVEVHPYLRERVADALSYAAVLLVLGGAALAVWGYRSHPWGGMAGLAGTLAWLKLGAGGAAAVLGLVVCATNVEYFSLRYRHAWVREALRLRGDALVNPDDPEAIYVYSAPRARWTISGPHSDDVGFLRPDSRARQLLFEGLRRRYRIPSHAVIDCEVEPVTYLGEPNTYTQYVTVVRARRGPSASGPFPSGESGLPWETSWIAVPVGFQPNRKRDRYRRALELRDRIANAMEGRPAPAAAAGFSCDGPAAGARAGRPAARALWQELEMTGDSVEEEAPPGGRVAARRIGDRLLLDLRPGPHRALLPYARIGAVFTLIGIIFFPGFVVCGAALVRGNAQLVDSMGPLIPEFLGVIGALTLYRGWLRPRFTKTSLLLERERLTVKHSLFGRERFEEHRLRPDSRAESGVAPPRKRPLTRKGNDPPEAVTVYTAAEPAKFGRYLSDEDKRLLAERINQYLQARNGGQH